MAALIGGPGQLRGRRSQEPVSESPFNQANRRPLERHRHELLPLSAFRDEHRAPTDLAIRQILGDAHDAWTELRALVAERIGPLSEVWKCTSATKGWGLRIVCDDRVVLYMTPQPRQFVVSFALGERAVVAARAARLPASVLQVIEAAPGFVDGRRVRITVRDDRDIATLTELAQIKRALIR